MSCRPQTPFQEPPELQGLPRALQSLPPSAAMAGAVLVFALSGAGGSLLGSQLPGAKLCPSRRFCSVLLLFLPLRVLPVMRCEDRFCIRSQHEARRESGQAVWLASRSARSSWTSSRSSGRQRRCMSSTSCWPRSPSRAR